MKVTVLWSGGFDSTALIFHHLAQGDDVALLSVELENNPEQSRAESLARKWILELITHEFGRELPHFATKWPTIYPSGFGLTQPPLWLSAAAYNASTDVVSAGWVKGDDVWHHKEDLRALMAALNKFRERPMEIMTPFEWVTKEELLTHYVHRPLVFQLLSSSERGVPWAAGGEQDQKCRELRRLAEILRAKAHPASYGVGSEPADAVKVALGAMTAAGQEGQAAAAARAAAIAQLGCAPKAP